MIRLLLIRLWPVFVPLLIYVAWMFYRRRIARKQDAEIPGWKDGPWLWAVIATFVLAVGGFLFLGLSAPSNRDTTYEPIRFQDGKLIQERMD